MYIALYWVLPASLMTYYNLKILHALRRGHMPPGLKRRGALLSEEEWKKVRVFSCRAGHE